MTKAIITNKPVSNNPVIWELTEDPKFYVGEQFLRNGVLYEIRKIYPLELEEKPNGKYDLLPRKYDSFPLPDNQQP